MGLNAWLGTSGLLETTIDDNDKAFDTARRIAEQPTSIVIRRAGVEQAAQTVRLEVLTPRTDISGPAGNQGQKQDMLILGYRGHPTLSTTVIYRGDRFFHAGQMYVVVDVWDTLPGRMLAVAEASGEQRS
jgi:hypothetical protein